jgi:hypothetical protein
MMSMRPPQYGQGCASAGGSSALGAFVSVDCIWEAGTSPTTAMTHIAVQEALNGKPVEWMEHVSDEQYRK